MLNEHFSPPDSHVSKQLILWCVSTPVRISYVNNVRDGVSRDNEAVVFLKYVASCIILMLTLSSVPCCDMKFF